MTKWNELDFLKEATCPPSQHRHPLVEFELSTKELVLTCLLCEVYWHTGIVEDPHHVVLTSLRRLVSEAEKRYRAAA